MANALTSVFNEPNEIINRANSPDDPFENEDDWGDDENRPWLDGGEG